MKFVFAYFTLIPAAVLAEVSYNQDIRPILAENCFYCHGQDPNKRKADLRLDVREVAVEFGAFVPGKPDESELVSRLFSHDPDELMPPAKSNRKLTEKQKALLKQWINEGAKYEKQWTFQAPVKAPLPAVKKVDWVRNEIDRFVLAKLEASKLQPSPEADKATLIRRLSLDLIGLSPSPAEVDAFVADTAADAYEKLVERLLKSDHYGERMALPWLDAARYADSNGFQQDGDTFQWVWRDWVVKALNADMPFSQFSIEQLAGDLLPNATQDQMIATAFNRNHLLNGEGGAIAEEQRFNILFDRVDTTSTTWLGLTMACAQCHDHKYDPMTQRDYYSMLALFNQVPESGTPSGSGQYRIADPWIAIGSDEQKAKLKSLEAALAEAKKAEGKAERSPETVAAFEAAEKDLLKDKPVEWAIATPQSMTATGGAVLSVLNDQSIFADGPSPDTSNYTITLPAGSVAITGFRIETIPDLRLPKKGAGRGDSGNAVLTKLRVKAGGAEVALNAASATYSQGGFSPQGVIDDDPNTAWAFYPEIAKPYILIVQCATPIPTSADGKVELTFEFQSAHKQHTFGRFRIASTGDSQPASRKALPDEIAAIVKKLERSKDEAKKLRDYVSKNAAPAALVAIRGKTKTADKAMNDFRQNLLRVMVMSDSKPRDTFILDRGEYLKPLDKVNGATPSFLPPAAKGSPQNRLGFAQWLFQPEHPLTSRVQVNRMWQTLFGIGLVKTVEDLGVQSEAPVHGALLDWLAVEFRERGWSMKHLHRLIVTSATYRQSSQVSRELAQNDPENRLLARGARFRMPSMILRDMALASSGLLEARIGGAPVYPYQPDQIWETLAITKERDFTYPISNGKDLYRRSLYTFWRRTVGPANMFDAANRQVCKVRQNITNTPLHALTTLNDPTWAEAARVLAARSMESANDTDVRLTYAARRVLGRPLAERDRTLLRKAFDKQLAIYQTDLKAAAEVMAIGSAAKNEKLNPAEHAAFTAVCLMLLNLDEALTRE
ncbi:MAG: PSD1 and planctomycete cytochrome C domain-containing protein [Verrucomicrobia bacterium]|nr:PSD1 and planctomycete cytochrome C domain-containing protein [Verrucomicrobiota bacterium]